MRLVKPHTVKSLTHTNITKSLMSLHFQWFLLIFPRCFLGIPKMCCGFAGSSCDSAGCAVLVCLLCNACVLVVRCGALCGTYSPLIIYVLPTYSLLILYVFPTYSLLILYLFPTYSPLIVNVFPTYSPLILYVFHTCSLRIIYLFSTYYLLIIYVFPT